MLYIKDNIVKDSSLITLEINGKNVYNPSQELLEENGWSLFSQDNIIQFSNKRFIETTSDVFDNVDKDEYVDTIVFLKDLKKIYLNGEYFGGEDLSVEYDDYNPNYNNHYVGEVNINGNSFEIGVPSVDYEGYEDSYEIGQLTIGNGGFPVCTPNNICEFESVSAQDIHIGNLVFNNGNRKAVCVPNQETYYESYIEQNSLTSTKIGTISNTFSGEEFDIYIPKIKEPEFIKNITLEELNDLKNSKKLIPGQKYNITNFKTIIDENIGNVIYKDNEEHHILVEAIKNDTLNDDAKSISFANSKVPGESSSLEPTGDFELIAYKCDINPETGEYEFDDAEVYKYKGDTIEIDGVTHYIWNKYENGAPYLGWCGEATGKSRVATSSLDFECSLDNPYHPEYFIYDDDTINDQYRFEEPNVEEGNDGFTDSFGRVERIDHPVYNYKVIADVCDWDNDNEEYGYDDSSWYAYCGDTIDLDGVTYFIWYKPNIDTSNSPSICYPLTDTLYLDCSIENPYTPELWVTVDGELNNDYFDPTETDIFCGIYESNLPSLSSTDEIVIEDTNFKSYTCDVKVDLDTKKILDESQIVSAVAFKTKFKFDSETNYSYPDYEGLYLYHGETMDINEDSYRVWDKYSNDTGDGFISVDYRKDNGYYWVQILTEKLYIDCSLKNPYTQDYVIQEGDTINGYEIGGDKIVDIHYFNNVTNYIRFTNNGWYVRCPELDRDGKFGWAYIAYEINSQDGSTYSWGSGDGHGAGPIPCFLNNPDLDNNDYFLTDTLDPQVGDQFRWCDSEYEDLDTIDKVWGTEIKPPAESCGIYWMKDEFGNEAPYDFKHIQFEGLYTFGNETEDYSLNGFENKVYNNKIMKPIDTQYNRINFSEKNVYGNTIYPSVTGCVIDFSVKESLITKSELGLHVFDPTSFITPIRVNPLVVSENQIINYTTSDEQIVYPKQDAFGDANIISNKYK